MTACERTGCEHRHIDDDGFCAWAEPKEES